jgi:hypothetical protein
MGARHVLGQSREGVITRTTYLYKGVHMSIPYCTKHLIIGLMGRWFFIAIALPVLILGMVVTLQITENTFLNEGDILPVFRFFLALFVGMVLAQGVTWGVRRVGGLVFPVVNDMRLPLESVSGLLGVKAEMTYEQFALILRNDSVAMAVRQLNTGQPGAATGIEVWPARSKPARSSSAATSPTDSRSATGRWIALVIGVLILVGACLCIGLAIAAFVIAGQGISPVLP